MVEKNYEAIRQIDEKNGRLVKGNPFWMIDSNWKKKSSTTVDGSEIQWSPVEGKVVLPNSWRRILYISAVCFGFLSLQQ